MRTAWIKMTLLEQIIWKIEQEERIERMRAERERRKNILKSNNHYIEDFNEETREYRNHRKKI